MAINLNLEPNNSTKSDSSINKFLPFIICGSVIVIMFITVQIIFSVFVMKEASMMGEDVTSVVYEDTYDNAPSVVVDGHTVEHAKSKSDTNSQMSRIESELSNAAPQYGYIDKVEAAASMDAIENLLNQSFPLCGPEDYTYEVYGRAADRQDWTDGLYNALIKHGSYYNVPNYPWADSEDILAKGLPYDGFNYSVSCVPLSEAAFGEPAVAYIYIGNTTGLAHHMYIFISDELCYEIVFY